MPKTKEELEQLKKDYQKLTEQASQLSEEELENVTGGSSCQSFSDATYDSLGFTASEDNGQNGSYHPLIITVGNSCKLVKGGSTCLGCDYRVSSTGILGGMLNYCRARSKEHDPGY